MRRIVFAGAALSLSVLAMGCFGSSNQDQPGSAGAGTSAPAWTLTLKSNCVYAEDTQCVGKYGFSVSADGKYQVGPGPKGQVRQGALSETEFAELNTKLQAALASAHMDGTRAESHESGVENESDDTLTLTRQSRESVLAHNTGAEYYFATANLDEAKSLHSAIRDLAKSYYRLPFGNDCADAADHVEGLYAALQSCQSDADCVYVDAVRGYEVIPPTSVQYLFTEDCKAVRPLTVANKVAIQGGATGLVEAYRNAAATCGQEFYRSSCAYDQKATSESPKCVQNRCQSRL